MPLTEQLLKAPLSSTIIEPDKEGFLDNAKKNNPVKGKFLNE